MALKTAKTLSKPTKARPNLVKKMVKRAMPNKRNSISWQGVQKAARTGAISFNKVPNLPTRGARRGRKPARKVGTRSSGIGVGI